jgi:Zn-dependent protease
MAWQDRHYYRDQSGGTGSPLMWLFTGSIPLFTVFGIRVRAHASMLVLVVLEMLFSTSAHGMGVWNAMTFSTILFGIILLHEFGHCFAARSVGGEANDILMWPLGGLAYADAPNRAWPQFWTAAGGPLVNVAICILTGGALAIMNHGKGIFFNPLHPHFALPAGSQIAYYLWFIFTISWGLFWFNMIPAYPLDGGRLLQAGLWFKVGHYRASMIAYAVGMVVAVLMTMYGIAFFFSWYGQILCIIGINSFMICYTSRMALKAEGPYETDDGIDYSAAYEINPTTTHKRKVSRWSIRRAAKRAQKVAAEERQEREHIDAILAKVSAHGMQSLTWLEKRALKKATQHQRQRDVETPRRHG